MKFYPKISSDFPTQNVQNYINLKIFYFIFTAKGTLSEDTIRLFLRQLGKLFIKFWKKIEIHARVIIEY